MENRKSLDITAIGSKADAIDPFKASLDSLLVIAFFKSRASSYPLVVGIAETASQYGLFVIDGKPMHVAVFGRNQSDAGKASAIIWYTLGWKGILLFSRGKLIPNGYPVLEVINCYSESCLCTDKRAHCHAVIDDPFLTRKDHIVTPTSISINLEAAFRSKMKREVRIDRYMFPCKYLFSRFSFQSDHPSSWEDQIQAGAVRAGCDICPNLEPGRFQKCGFRVIEEDVFS
jgi:hypothetical protein